MKRSKLKVLQSKYTKYSFMTVYWELVVSSRQKVRL